MSLLVPDSYGTVSFFTAAFPDQASNAEAKQAMTKILHSPFHVFDRCPSGNP